MEKTPKWGALLLLLLCAAAMAAQTAPSWTNDSRAVSPMARDSHAMAYDSAHARTVLFGGISSSGQTPVEFNDTWVWDGANWTEESPEASPPARQNHAMAYDSAHGQAVLFGGYFQTTEYGDTWVWDGTNWTQESPATSPPARDSFAMAYDAAHGQVVIFGGELLQNDTWVWDGSNWTQKSPATIPPGRYAPAMAYDSVRGQVVLFGGLGADTPNGLNDTWVWDGSNWTQKSPQTSPPARWQLAMAYDSAHGQVVLFGGRNLQNNHLGDTWVWDGTNWTQESPQANPPGRFNDAMDYDAAHDQVVLFGGLIPTQNPKATGVDAGDTWLWNGGVLPATGPTISGVVSASAFGGFSSVAPGSWVEIYGSNLGPDTEGWTSAEFNGNNAPTSLHGVSVSIGEQAAFVDYISASQVNAQLPSNISTGGALQLAVTNANGTSMPVNITVNTTEPGLLAPASFKIGSNQYVVAQLPDGSYVLPTGAIAGVNSRPAKPGETIVIYGVGFGSVTPNILAGEIVTEANQLAESFEISFGKTPAQLPYFGLAPSFVGLYQFNVTVPAVADNDLVPLTFNLAGAAGTQTLFTAVHQ